MHLINVPGVGEVELRKSRRARRVILSITPEGTARITIPSYLPLAVGKQYALKQRQWLIEHTHTKEPAVITPHQSIGREHTVIFKRGTTLGSRVSKSQITITLDPTQEIEDSVVQAEAKKACTRAIRKEAETVLPSRLYRLASQYGYQFKEVRCKALKTRWGSCSSEKIINLNIWLMQLPDELIEYVLAHELAHLRHPHHQPAFWQEVSQMIPDYQQQRKTLKLHRPSLILQT